MTLSELNDSSDEDLLPIKNIAMSVIQNASEEQLNQPVQDWMEWCYEQGVMWLPLYQNTNDKNDLANKLVKAWPAILLKIIKIILEEKANGPKKRGLAFVLLGKKARSLEQIVRADPDLVVNFLQTNNSIPDCTILQIHKHVLGYQDINRKTSVEG